MKHAKKTLVGAVATMLLLSSCATSGTTEEAETQPTGNLESLSSLIEAAEKEGNVRVYTSIMESDLERLVTEFEATYDITVEAMRLGPSDALNRFDTETEAKTPSADLVMVADPRYFGPAAEDGRTVALADSGVLELIPDFPEDMLLPHFNTAVLQVVNAGFAYNTKNVTEAELPDTWEDLLDPRWTGKLLTTPPDSSINQTILWGRVAEELGTEFIAKLGPQIGREYPNVVPMAEGLSAGEGDIALSVPEFMVLDLQARGATIGFHPVSPSVLGTLAMGVAADATNPNAARLLAHFLLSEEGNNTITNPDIGAFGPWDGDLIPADFAVPDEAEYALHEKNREEILSAYRGE